MNPITKGACALLAFYSMTLGTAWASEIVMDTLLVAGGPSPWLAVRVNIIPAGTRLAELNLGPTGTLKVQKGVLVHFKKGQEYLVQASCISGSGFVQQSGLKFTADGRTIIVQFADNGFQIKRGGVAY